MAKQVADVQFHAAEDDDLEDIDVNVDQIEDGLYLGKLYRKFFDVY